jgi:predicted nucleic acid-binding protein
MLPSTLLADADLFISYLTGDVLEPLFATVVNETRTGSVELLVSSEVYDDIITALRSQSIPISRVMEFVSDMRKIPHRALPVTADISTDALRIYQEHGGPRRLHYFDSYHVATARNYGASLLTSDKYVIRNAGRLRIDVIDVRNLKPTGRTEEHS